MSVGEPQRRWSTPRHPNFESHGLETRLETGSLQKGVTIPSDRFGAMTLLNEVVSRTTRPIHIGHSTFPVSLTPLPIPHRIQLVTVDQDLTVSPILLPVGHVLCKDVVWTKQKRYPQHNPKLWIDSEHVTEMLRNRHRSNDAIASQNCCKCTLANAGP